MIHAMPKVTAQISISLDGYVAGPDQSADDPLGRGGMALHEWAFTSKAWREQHGLEGGQDDVDSRIAEQVMSGLAAFVMGRKMFGGGPGAWDLDWRGWWGEEPPYHAPVFVLTHHPREPLVMEGGTTFTFVTDGIESAVEQARAAAGDLDVGIAGGASTVQQALAAGLLDELHLHHTPVLLRAGERLLENVGAATRFEQLEVVASDTVSHVRYRVVR